MKRNQEIRDYAKSKQVYLYELAEINGISYTALVHRLHKPLNGKDKAKYLSDIDQIALDKQADDN